MNAWRAALMKACAPVHLLRQSFIKIWFSEQKAQRLQMALAENKPINAPLVLFNACFSQLIWMRLNEWHEAERGRQCRTRRTDQYQLMIFSWWKASALCFRYNLTSWFVCVGNVLPNMEYRFCVPSASLLFPLFFLNIYYSFCLSWSRIPSSFFSFHLSAIVLHMEG